MVLVEIAGVAVEVLVETHAAARAEVEGKLAEEELGLVQVTAEELERAAELVAQGLDLVGGLVATGTAVVAGNSSSLSKLDDESERE